MNATFEPLSTINESDAVEHVLTALIHEWQLD